MNVFGLAKFNTSKMHKTSKPQTNVPVKICHFKVPLRRVIFSCAIKQTKYTMHPGPAVLSMTCTLCASAVVCHTKFYTAVCHIGLTSGICYRVALCHCLCGVLAVLSLLFATYSEKLTFFWFVMTSKKI